MFYKLYQQVSLSKLEFSGRLIWLNTWFTYWLDWEFFQLNGTQFYFFHCQFIFLMCFALMDKFNNHQIPYEIYRDWILWTASSFLLILAWFPFSTLSICFLATSFKVYQFQRHMYTYLNLLKQQAHKAKGLSNFQL